MLEFLKAPFLVLHFPYYTYDLPDVICNYAIYADQAPDLWQQIELASRLESDLQDTVDCGR